MNQKRLFLLILLVPLLLSGCALLQSTPEARTLVSSDLPIRLIWTSRTDERIVSQPVIGDSVIAVKTQMNLYGYDTLTGEKLWKRHLTSGISTPIRIADDTIYFGDYKCRVWALDGKTGSELWHYDFEGDADYVGDIVIAPSHHMMYAAAAPHISVVAIAVWPEEVVWEKHDSLGLRGVDLFLNGDELIVAPIKSFHVLNRETGEDVRYFTVDNRLEIGVPKQMHNGRLYGAQTVLDAETFEVIAKLKSPTTKLLGDKCERFLPPYTFNRDLMYAAGSCGGLFALDIGNNYHERWSVYEPTYCAASTGIFRDVLYFLTADGDLVGIEPLSGRQIGTLSTDRKPTNIASDGAESYAGVVTSQENMIVYFGDMEIWNFRSSNSNER